MMVQIHLGRIKQGVQDENIFSYTLTCTCYFSISVSSFCAFSKGFFKLD